VGLIVLYAQIKQYSYKPTPIFYGDNGLHTGVEIEVRMVESVKLDRYAFMVSKETNGFAYCKSDSSIGYGFEIVTHPFTIEEERKSSLVRSIYDVFDRENSKGKRFIAGREDSVTSCGIHVHCSKASFDKQQIIDVADFFLKNKTFIEKVSHRQDLSRLDRYAKIDLLSNLTQRRALKENYDSSSHYSAIHATRYTYEFRIFNSTTNYSEFMSFLEFVNMMRSAPVSSMSVSNLFDYANDNGYFNFIEQNIKLIEA
jgi:hypothetical protein